MLAVDERDHRGKRLPEGLRERLQQRLKGLEGKESLVRVVDDLREAEFLLRPGAGVVYLVPAARATKFGDQAEVTLYGPIKDDEGLIANLRKSLQRIARVINLQKLATAAAGARGAAQVEVKLTRRSDPQDRAGKFPIVWRGRGMALYNQDQVVLHIKNPGAADIDVTLLYIDNQYGITCFFPMEEYNRLAPGDSRSIALELEADSLLHEHLVVIAVRGPGQPIDFAVLKQPRLPKARGPTLERSLNSPLGKLLSNAMYAEGNTRGVEGADLRDFTINLISWQIRPEMRPKETE